MKQRKGVSLIEILLVIAIFGVLIAITIPAVAKLCSAAALSGSQNNLRQISLGFHDILSRSDDKMSRLPGTNPNEIQWNKHSVFIRLAFDQFLPKDYKTDYRLKNNELQESMFPQIKVFQSPADPSLNHLIPNRYLTKNSYVANMMAFDARIKYPVSFPDGTSSTIAFCETYWYASHTGLGAENP
jgi:prepilin-type N-terminal cleavage/methylation domain-containing protein